MKKNLITSSVVMMLLYTASAPVTLAISVNAPNKGDELDPLMEKLSLSNNMIDQNKLGDIYKKGVKVAQDYKKAFSWYTKSANQGYAPAQSNLGDLYQQADGVERDYKQAFNWYTRSAKQGYSKAENNLGDLYENGEGVKQDYEKAISWYKKAMQQQDGDAYSNLGYMYQNGYGVSQDYAYGLSLIHQGVNLGSSYAITNLGAAYEFKMGVDKDYKQAMYWYKKGMKLGNPYAFYNLAGMYYYGAGVEEDKEKAEELYYKSAKLGLDLARHKIAQIFYKKDGHYIETFYWLMKSAKQGNAEDQYYVAKMMYSNTLESKIRSYTSKTLYTNKPTELDIMYSFAKEHFKYGSKASYYWYKRSAQNGDLTAQKILSFLYLQGKETEKNPVKAFAWAYIHMKNSGQNYDFDLDDVRRKITKDQQNKGYALAKKLIKQYPKAIAE